MVRAEGLEPPQLSSLEPKSSASTSSATPASSIMSGRDAAGGGCITWAHGFAVKKWLAGGQRAIAGQNGRKMVRIGNDKARFPADPAPPPGRIRNRRFGAGDT